MTGRVYLDWNASAPLRPEAREAMLAAMNVVGNPSSVHAEGRAAKAIVEKARGQVATLVGCETSEVVFTSGATEAAAMVLGAADVIFAADADHDCLVQWRTDRLDTDRYGQVDGASWVSGVPEDKTAIVCWTDANSETGVSQILLPDPSSARILFDFVQSIGRSWTSFKDFGVDYALASAHKMGGPKGVGALIARTGLETTALLRGGGQEQGRRSGTENVIGIAGFGAAAAAARRGIDDHAWDRVEKMRNMLEVTLAAAAPDIVLCGQGSSRLPNTSCFAVPGWRGETQVMQMDLAGYAISAGSACSSGKVNKASRVLLAMGYDEVTASSAIRVSMGPTTTEAEVMGFADTWIEHYRRRKSRAA
jgi:cysteine desulfurase